jgi:tRNA (guanine37-N1)-methyltransferase
MFPGSLSSSLAGDALEKGLWSYKTVNIRDFGVGKHKNVDDSPYGGGAGMVLRADVLGEAIESQAKPGKKQKLIYMSPRGKQLTQQKVTELAELKEIAIICGRFEGIDERVLEHYEVEEISLGDYILSGGEPAALILMDAVIRVLPNVLGNKETHDEESFSNGLLEYPHYTRPPEWNGRAIPEILVSGNHAKVAEWRKQKSIEVTKKNRPDLL